VPSSCITAAIARTIYNRDHPNGLNGANHKYIPLWAQSWFHYFVALDNYVAPSVQAVAVQSERNMTVASVVGHQAPLGVQGGGPVELRLETSRNIGAPIMSRQVVDNINVERANAVDAENLVEGRDGAACCNPAPWHRTNNGTRRRNICLPGFAPGENDPSSRFVDIQGGYRSLNRLADALSHSITGRQSAPPRRPIEMGREFRDLCQLLENATVEDEGEYYRSLLEMMRDKVLQFRNGSSDNNHE